MYPIIKIKEPQGKFRYSSVPVIYSNQNCKCFYCGKYLQYKKYHPENVTRKDGYTLDHLFPKMLGFTLYGNAVIACRKCNEKKSDRPPTPVEIVKAWELYRQMNMKFIATIIFP
jgi:5-methylcytosine-specific restriction endonuclease McrA